MRRGPVLAAVCFDLDGVLIDTMRLHAQAWQEALHPFGLRVSRRLIYEWEGEPGLATARALLQRAHRARRAPEARMLLARKERRFSELARGVRVPALLVRLIRALAARTVPLALVTGTSRREVRRVLAPETLRRFDVIVTGNDVRHGKPHPEPYRQAFRRLAVPARKTLVVENAPYGIRAARAAGAGYVLALRGSLPAPFLRGADEQVCSVARLTQRVLTLLHRPRLTAAAPSR